MAEKKAIRPKLYYPLALEAPLLQGFGERPHTYARFGMEGHNGLDLGVQRFTPVKAMANGTIRFAGEGIDEQIMGSAAGLCVLITHRGYLTGYAHLSKVYATAGTKVKAGDVIGLSGNTGATTGAHLHLELLKTPLQLDNGYLGRCDPLPYLRPADSRNIGAKALRTRTA